MSVNYSAGVFFGACVRLRSPLGERLDEYVDNQGGTPARTEVSGVEISMVGSDGEWLTIQACGSTHRYGRHDGDCPDPVLLIKDPKWRARIETFLVAVGASELPIGWHFQGSAS